MSEPSNAADGHDSPLFAIQEVQWSLLFVREPSGDRDVTTAGGWLFIDQLGHFEGALGNAFTGRLTVTAERLLTRGMNSTQVGYAGDKGFIDRAGRRVLTSSPRWLVEDDEATLLDEDSGTALLLIACRRQPGRRVLW